MALKLIQQVKYCPNCNKNTICNQNSKEISWVMHLVLTIFTAGFWLLFFFIMAFFHMLNKPISQQPWICSECGINTNFNSNLVNVKNSHTGLNKNIEPKHILIAFIGLTLFASAPTTAISLLCFAGIAYGIVFIVRASKT